MSANLVAKDWDANAHQGFVTNSVVVFVVRKGNPLHIHNWSDLIKPGVKIVTPNPESSGSARWNIMAAYGAQLKLVRHRHQALAYVRVAPAAHVVTQPGQLARSATQAFTAGNCDVLLSYENEAIEAQQAGKAVDYVIPKQTILIQNPIAVTSDAGSKTTGHQLREVPLYRPGAEDLRCRRVTGRSPCPPTSARRSSRRRPSLFNIGYARWLGHRGPRSSSDPTNGVDHEDRRAAGTLFAKWG